MTPQHPHWHSDLPVAAKGCNESRAYIHEQINNANEVYLDFGRERLAVRGLVLLLGVFLLVITVAGCWFILGMEPSDGVFNVFALLFSFVWAAVALYFIKLDIFSPREVPVRFNRLQQKIYFNCYIPRWNPFARWRSIVKVWEWADTRAEVMRVAGFNGKIYTVRYSMLLTRCEPGTHRVLEREFLMGPSMTTVEYDHAWTYLCKYMAGGLRAVPEVPLKDGSVHYIRSLFEYMPWMMLNEWGRSARREMFGRGVAVALASLFLVIVTVPLVPLFLPLGMTNYIALKLAPQARWPEDADAASRGITVMELRDEKQRASGRPEVKARLSSVIAGCLTVALLALMAGASIYLLLVKP
ncbi:hypothetical protein M8A51_09235 [Schlegelella sp. S2-27]|uniref:DUF6708 domain-containing protein n=1 Tax=Caldimonas mangrovi TaxID=2944811 RepID=A0ABT0YLV4_9BURK|nr:DUF6708 domain-containing protein [Caldimonas mangrovi]MCM5679717.1 hypothetical protein [Caldimonas mangrovi]